MCMWFGFNPAVNFCNFSTLLTLSFFAGATSTSPKFDLYFVSFVYILMHLFVSFVYILMHLFVSFVYILMHLFVSIVYIVFFLFFLLVSWVICGLWLWQSMDFSFNFFLPRFVTSLMPKLEPWWNWNNWLTGSSYSLPENDFCPFLVAGANIIIPPAFMPWGI